MGAPSKLTVGIDGKSESKSSRFQRTETRETNDRSQTILVGAGVPCRDRQCPKTLAPSLIGHFEFRDVLLCQNLQVDIDPCIAQLSSELSLPIVGKAIVGNIEHAVHVPGGRHIL